MTAAGWTHHHRQATGAAVKAGLIPNLKPLNPNTQRRDTIVILGGSGNYYPGGGGTDYFQDQELNVLLQFHLSSSYQKMEDETFYSCYILQNQ